MKLLYQQDWENVFLSSNQNILLYLYVVSHLKC